MKQGKRNSLNLPPFLRGAPGWKHSSILQTPDSTHRVTRVWQGGAVLSQPHNEPFWDCTGRPPPSRKSEQSCTWDAADTYFVCAENANATSNSASLLLMESWRKTWRRRGSSSSTLGEEIAQQGKVADFSCGWTSLCVKAGPLQSRSWRYANMVAHSLIMEFHSYCMVWALHGYSPEQEETLVLMHLRMIRSSPLVSTKQFGGLPRWR